MQTVNTSIQRREHRTHAAGRISWLRFLSVCGLVIITGSTLVACSRSSSGKDEVGSSSKALAPPVTTPVSQVSIQSLQFSPATLEVNKGDVVEWKNDDLIPHTATSPEFDSGAIKSGQPWRYTFKQEGNFPYICTFHPQMKGVVIVKEFKEDTRIENKRNEK